MCAQQPEAAVLLHGVHVCCTHRLTKVLLQTSPSLQSAQVICLLGSMTGVHVAIQQTMFVRVGVKGYECIACLLLVLFSITMFSFCSGLYGTCLLWALSLLAWSFRVYGIYQ